MCPKMAPDIKQEGLEGLWLLQRWPMLPHHGFNILMTEARAWQLTQYWSACFCHYSPRSTCYPPSEPSDINGHKHDQLKTNWTDKQRALNSNSFLPADPQLPRSAASLDLTYNPQKGTASFPYNSNKQAHLEKTNMSTASSLCSKLLTG